MDVVADAIAWNPSKVLGSITFGDGSTDTIVWTWDRLTGTDPSLTFGSGSISLNGDWIGANYYATGQSYYLNTAGDRWIKLGTGSPEGAATGRIGSIWLASDGTTNTTMWIKEAGTGNTGWRAFGSSGGSVATDTIWDAAGDLAVGSGANTASKLTMGSALQVLRVNAGATALEYATLSSGGNALTTDPLSQFAATTSAQLFGVVSDETGSGTGALAMFNIGPYVHNGATGPGYIDFREDSDNGSNRVRLIGPASVADISVTLPSASGTLLNTDGSGASLTNVTPSDNTVTAAKMANGDHGAFTYTSNLAALDSGNTYPSPIITGTETRTNAVSLVAGTAIAAFAIDVTKPLGTKTITQNETFTFSATPAAGTIFSARINATGGAWVATIPSSYSESNGTITSVTVPSGGSVTLTWEYDGSVYRIYGDPLTSFAGLTSSDSPQFAGVNVGHASDTTLARVSAGVLSVEGVTLATVAGNIGAATATTPSAADSDTSVATTAFVQTELDATFLGSAASPITGTQSPSWSGPILFGFVGGTATHNLPAAAGYAGRAYAFKFLGSYVLTVEPNGSEIIYRAGAAQSAGVNITVTGTIDQNFTILSDGTSWIVWYSSATVAVGT
jgi:hypothetical protein